MQGKKKKLQPFKINKKYHFQKKIRTNNKGTKDLPVQCSRIHKESEEKPTTKPFSTLIINIINKIAGQFVFLLIL